MDFKQHLEDQASWSLETFGPAKRTEGLLRHIVKEVGEVRENPDQLSEWIDIIILACDGALRRGFLPEEIASTLEAKMAENRARKWPDWRFSSDEEPIEHLAD